MNIKEKLQILHDNHLGHFMYLPKKFGYDVFRHNGITVIRSAQQSSMFNIVYGQPTSYTHDVIDSVKNFFPAIRLHGGFLL